MPEFGIPGLLEIAQLDLISLLDLYSPLRLALRADKNYQLVGRKVVSLMSDKHYVHPHDENQLANALKQSRPWLDQYGTSIIYGIAAILGVTAIVVYLQRTPPATAPASAALLVAENDQQYRDVADQFENTEIGTVARLQQGDMLLSNAIGNMFRNRKVAVTELESAKAAYERLADQADVTGDLKVRVLAGLARVAECENDGTEEKNKAAIAAWQRILDEFPDSKVFKTLAEDRVKRLKMDSTRQFYAWFAKQDPKPGDDLLMPQDGPRSNVPAIPNPFDLQGLGMPGSSGTSTEGATPGEGAASGGLGDLLTPDATTPAAEGTPAPAAETPAPATETPATETPAPATEGVPAAEGSPTTGTP